MERGGRTTPANEMQGIELEDSDNSADDLQRPNSTRDADVRSQELL